MRIMQHLPLIIHLSCMEHHIQFKQHVHKLHVKMLKFSYSTLFSESALLTMHGPDALKALEVPEFNSHIC